jgi:hypothetical protein
LVLDEPLVLAEPLPLFDVLLELRLVERLLEDVVVCAISFLSISLPCQTLLPARDFINTWKGGKTPGKSHEKPARTRLDGRSLSLSGFDFFVIWIRSVGGG